MKNLCWYVSFVILLFSSCRDHENSVYIAQIQAEPPFPDSLIVIKDLPPLTGTASDTMIAEQYWTAAKELLAAAKPDSAITLAKEAKTIFLQYYEEKNLKIGDIWSWIGYVQTKLPSNIEGRSDAFMSYDSALAIYLHQQIVPNHRIHKAYRQLGSLYMQKKEYEKAQEYYQKILDYLSELPFDSLHSWPNSYNIIGYDYLKLGNDKVAEDCFQQSLSITTANKDSLGMSEAYERFGALHYHRKQYKKSLANFKKVLRIRIKHPKLNPEKTADIYNNVGILYRHFVQFRLSIDHQEIALKIYTEIDKKIKAADVYSNLASSYIDLGQFQKAEEYLQKASNIYVKEDKYSHPAHAKILLKLGVRYEREFQHNEALVYYNKALEIYYQYPREMVTTAIAQIYLNKGVIHHREQRYDEAINDYQEALNLGHEAYRENDPRYINLYNLIGYLHRLKEEYDSALKYYKKSLYIALENYDSIHPIVGESFNLIADYHMQIGNLSTARYNNNLVFKSLNYTLGGSLDSCLSVRKLIPYILERIKIEDASFASTDSLHYLEEANRVAHIAVEAFNSLKNSYLDPVSKEELMTSMHTLVFENAIRTSLQLLEKGDRFTNGMSIFRYMEQSKAILSLEAIRKANAREFLNLPDSLLNKEDSLKLKIAELEKKRFQETANTRSKDRRDSLYSHYTEMIGDANRSFDNLRQIIKEFSPAYYQQAYYDSVITIETLQQKLLKPNQVFIEYFTGDSTLFILAIRPDTFKVVGIELDKNNPLKEWVKQLNVAIFNQGKSELRELPPKQLDSISQQYVTLAHKIYQKTIYPIESLIDKGAELIITPDGILSYVPFDALLKEPPSELLRFDTYPYLLHDYQISIAYSATMLHEMRQKEHRIPPKKEFIGFAPSFPNDNSDTVILASNSIDYSNTRNRLGPLKYNIPEVESIQSLIGGDIYVDKKATKSAFINAADDYRILHLSTHGKANDKVGDFSFLAFHESTDSAENSWLYNRELYNLPLNADMVVLSACETGIGEWQKGEGIISMARGFSYAGAKSIITTLWSIDDQQTPELMEKFYRHLQSGMTKDAALRKAKLDYLQTGHHPEPYYWAAFVPIGDMQPIDFENKKVPLWVWILGGSVIILLTVRWVKKPQQA